MKIISCPDCKQLFAPANEDYDFSMFRSDLRIKAIDFMDSFCAECIAKRLMRGNFEVVEKWIEENK